MSYIENPKTKGSGIITCIPQKGLCPNGCEDCFFQSGRSYLEPLSKNLPNMPFKHTTEGRIVRVNDGNDSAWESDKVIKRTRKYDMKFYNTSDLNAVGCFNAPVVVTVNPSGMTDISFNAFDTRYYKMRDNLMFVRIRTNAWNIDGVVKPAVKYYSDKEVPIVLTFMAYYEQKPMMGLDYVFRKRTLNSYWAITTAAWMKIMDEFRLNKWVSSCGKIEGELGTTACRFCGNCLREYFATMERMR
jgi:hypothetical protein